MSCTREVTLPALSTRRAALVLLAVALPTGAGASIGAMSPEELCKLANVVVVATVIERDVEWMEDGTLFTTVKLAVVHVLTGDPGRIVQIGTLGGQIGDKIQHVGEEPALPLGSTYLLKMSRPGRGGPLLIGGRVGALRLDTLAVVPSDAELTREWEDACRPHR